MPLRVSIGGGPYARIKPSTTWQFLGLPAAHADVRVDENFYVDAKNMAAPAKP
jgi:hypothetical protein